ncbi:hypothetical protein D0Z00_003410 [Geotrichum galactomycetum]|uniref:Uncharacterized protein n=1 Tax=Geotrichum galactomycetum TaxID=27317 RepID=A0ACB6V1B3_9ASCO|nr:hypothetical protein D0Z00_003410 [Geotrichum candidum]
MSTQPKAGPTAQKLKVGRPKKVESTAIVDIPVDTEEESGSKDTNESVSETIQDQPVLIRSGSRRSTITGNEISPLYSEIRKTEESVVDIKIDDIKRQHELERVQWQAKIERLEDQLNVNVRLLSLEKDTRESQAKALKGLLNKAKAEADSLRVKVKSLEDLQTDYKQYRKTHPRKSLVAANNEETNQKDAEDLQLEFNEKRRELELKHAKEIEDLQADFAVQLANTEQHYQHRLEEEQNKLLLESQIELEKLGKVKDKELEIFKESQERKLRRTSQFVSTVEYEKLREEFEELSKQVEREKVSSAVRSRFASPNAKSPAVAANDAKQLRTELAELRKELVKKSNAVDKAQVELDKLRHQIQTSKSVTETKMTLLKNKIKGLETQLARKTELLRTPTNPLTPVAGGGSGPGTRFHRLAEPGTASKRGTLSATSTPIPKFSNFSTSPFLRTGGAAELKTIPGSTPSSRAHHRSPVITSSRSTTPVSKLVTPSKRPVATPRSRIPRATTGMVATSSSIRKLPTPSILRSRAQKISLFDEDDEVDEENGVIIDGSKPERRRKRKLNSIAIDIFDTDDVAKTPSKQGSGGRSSSTSNENDPDHPDTPGSAFKRVKLSTPETKQTISSAFKIRQKRGGAAASTPIGTEKRTTATAAAAVVDTVTPTAAEKKPVGTPARGSKKTSTTASSAGPTRSNTSSNASPKSPGSKTSLKKLEISPLRTRNRVNRGSFKV